MRLTVLGSAASWAGGGHACSGYLVEHEGTTLLVDCGNGALANAGLLTDVTSLDAVLISHAHTDHFADIYGLQAALRFSPEGPVGSLPLYLPEGLWDRLGALLSERGRAQLADAFEPHVLIAGEALEVGGITIMPHVVVHEGLTFAFTFDAGGARLAYTADTRTGEEARAAVTGCDVLIAECTLPDGYEDIAPHMTASDAAQLAEGSGAGMLILTHLWPGADHQRMLRQARSIFSGETHLAEELLSVEIPARANASKKAAR